MTKKFTVNDLGEMMLNLQSEVTEMNKKLDSFMSTVEKQREKINELCTAVQMQALKINQNEQQNRNECIKIIGLEADKKKQHSQHYIKNLVFESVFKPLLQDAVDDEDDDLLTLPDIHSLLKNAHVLPKSKKAAAEAPCPILVRLNAVDLKPKLFKHRREFMKKNPKISFFEDLTVVNSMALMKMRDKTSTASAWTRQGVILFTLEEDRNEVKKIHRLKNPFSVLEKDDIASLSVPYPVELPDLGSRQDSEEEN